MIASHCTTEDCQTQTFQFGKNWRRFLTLINDERIALAEHSLRRSIGHERLHGRTFLDVGSGSGLFSLAARRLGATVWSFDYDPESVACTQELRRRYFPEDRNWLIEQGSVLDRSFLATLGQHDIIYSWGVLHHTGQMWQAIENVKPLVKIGGQLVIAIYNDEGAASERWRRIKRRYNALMPLLRWPYAICIVAVNESRALVSALRNNYLVGYLRSWGAPARGMSRWHDCIDWIGGYPYECASVEEIVDVFGKDGFRLAALSEDAGHGCNEFVFLRETGLGIAVEAPLPESRFFLRRFGRRLEPPFMRTERGYLFKLPELQKSVAPCLIFRDGELIGPARRGDETDTVFAASAEWTAQQVAGAKYQFVRGYVRELTLPIHNHKRNMWFISVPDLAHLADNAPARTGKSPVFTFEDGRQLSSPHALHDDIIFSGRGRFSHWGNAVYFSTSDDSDPNKNGRLYRIVYPEHPS